MRSCLRFAFTACLLHAAPAEVIPVADFPQLQAAVQRLAAAPAGGTILLQGERYVGSQPLLLSWTDGPGRINLWAAAGATVALDFSASREHRRMGARDHALG